MPLLLHLSDVHLGARHADLGAAAVGQRERQLAAFSRAVDEGLARTVDVVLICGDLFDSNVQSRRSVERAVDELARLTESGIRVVIIPGTHDVYDSRSIYRAFDLPAMAGPARRGDLLTVLTPEQPELVCADLDLIVYGRVFATKRAPQSPLQGFAVGGDERASWKVGMIHGSRAIPGKVDHDDVIFSDAEVAASGLDYLALGHWHSFSSGQAGATTWCYPGAPEPVAVDQDGAGDVCVVHLGDGVGGQSSVRIERVRVGRTVFRLLTFDAAELAGQEDLERRIGELADPDLILAVTIAGVAPDSLEIRARGGRAARWASPSSSCESATARPPSCPTASRCRPTRSPGASSSISARGSARPRPGVTPPPPSRLVRCCASAGASSSTTLTT